MTSTEKGEPWVATPTVGDVLVRAAHLWPEAEALVFPESRQTFSELLHTSVDCARSLAGIEVRRGESVGILMPNSPDCIAALFACAFLGARVVMINARYKSYELAHVLADSGVVAVLTTDRTADYTDFAALLREAMAERPTDVRKLVLLGADAEGFLGREEFVAAAAPVTAEQVHAIRQTVRLSDVAVILYTSGTTASPKGCLLSHESLVRTAMAAAERWQLTPTDRFWDPLPMFHIGGIFPLLAMYSAGVCFVSQTHFTADEGLDLLANEAITYAYPVFPPITQPLISHPAFGETDLAAIRLVADAGPPESLANTQAHFPQAAVITLYGMTEAGGAVSFGRPDETAEERLQTCGKPLRGMEVRIVEPETDVDLPVSVRGEILVRGPGMFSGYHNAPELSAERLRDGWLHTGDLGVLDENDRLTYVGRLKDMIKVGGENVAALEIEAYLITHPSVKIAQVVGVPDERYDEVPAAFIELNPGAEVSESDIIDYCRGRIASFKVPRHVRFVREWPMSSTKIQKYRLRESIIAELDEVPREETSAV
jgi:fatty-acyl-CoA synthase